MVIFTFFRIIFLVCSIIGVFEIIPIFTAIGCGEYEIIRAFAYPIAISWILGAAFYLIGKKKKFSLSTRNVFVIVAFSWFSVCIFGSFPLWLSGHFNSFIDCVFESFSGFSTTGATILSEVENLPRSINLWRCEMHWLGGMGIIALTIALLPLLGLGAFQLIKAESTGVTKGKITPKMANTAETLWLVYVGFTFAMLISLLLCKLDFVDSLTLAFSTLGTGGFAQYNDSITGLNSLAVEIVCTVFMFLSGVNFTLYFFLITGRFTDVKNNSELKAYLLIVVVSILAITFSLAGYYGGFFKALRYSSFQVATIISTTGFSTADYLMWPSTAQLFIFFLFLIGGSSGSTAGGFKVIRHVILLKQAKNEMMRMLHPHGVFGIRLDGKPERKDIVFNVASFTFVYAIMVAISSIAGTIGGLDVFTSFTASLSMLGNIGPAFGTLGPSNNWGMIPQWLKLFYSFMMIVGRLELYNVVIMCIPEFWKK